MHVHGEVSLSGRKVQDIKTHNAVMIPAASWSYSNYLSLEGFYELALSIKSDASHLQNYRIQWSEDGASLTFSEKIENDFTADLKSITSKVKFKYVRIGLYNADSVPHTISSWTHLTT